VALELLIVDANVLIDFCLTDRSVLSLVSRHVGVIHVPEPILAEVEALDRTAAESLGIRVVAPELPLLTRAADASVDSPLSFEDWLCLLLAEKETWICVSNDKRLRRECTSRHVKVLWGLELVLRLVERKALDGAKAIAIAEAVCEMNPRIAPAVLKAFRRKLSG
jgi:rRNA-processing protein FCF1